MKNFVIIYLLFQTGYGFAQTGANVARKDYSDSLQKIVNVIKTRKEPDLKLLEFCFPTSNKESALFFQLDYQKENSPAFHALDMKIRKLAFNGNEAILIGYLTLSQFEDGYFAEAYFDEIDGFVSKHPEIFCRTIKMMTKEKATRLSEARMKAGCP